MMQLLRRMGEANSQSSLDKLMASLDADSSGKITKDEFEQWYDGKLSNLVGSPFDVLFGTTQAGAFWWFAQVLWLKTLVNVLFTFGTAQGWNWHVWLHLLLAASVALMVNQRPYISKLDQQVELFALLALALVAHISASFKAGTTWSPIFLVMTVALFAVPVLTFGFGTVYLKRKGENTTHNVARGHYAWNQIKQSIMSGTYVVTDEKGSKLSV